MKTKSILIVLFLVLSVQQGFAQDLGLMPFVGLSRTSTAVDMLGENETVTGYEVGAEYQWIEADEIKSASRIGLKNINADTGNFLASYEIEMNILTIGQSVSYDFDVAGNVLRPFAALDIGAGLAKANVDVLGEHAESDHKFMPYASAQVGARYVVNRFVPFVVGGYQIAKVKDVGFEGGATGVSSEVDFSGAYFTVGLGMVF